MHTSQRLVAPPASALPVSDTYTSKRTAELLDRRYRSHRKRPSDTTL
jgi:hypothetical protein